MCLEKNFIELSANELTDVSGGMAPAIVYAAGFALGTSPLVAVTICVAAASGGIALATYGKKHKKEQRTK